MNSYIYTITKIYQYESISFVVLQFEFVRLNHNEYGSPNLDMGFFEETVICFCYSNHGFL